MLMEIRSRSSAEYPAKLVDPATGLITEDTFVTVAGEGTYTINPSTGEVSFVPEPSSLLVLQMVLLFHYQLQLVGKDGKLFNLSTSNQLKLNTHQRSPNHSDSYKQGFCGSKMFLKPKRQP